MHPFIVSNDEGLAGRVRSVLKKLGCSQVSERSLNYDTALDQAKDYASAGAVALFCSAAFRDEDLAFLAKLSQACPGIRVVAIGTVLGPGMILKVIRSGAVDYLDINNCFESELNTLMQRLAPDRTRVVVAGKMYTVLGSAGGVGASLIAANLAVAIATIKQHCCLLDLHMRGGDQAKLFNAAPRHNLASLALKTHQLDKTMLEQAVVTHESGVKLLASPEGISDYRQLSPQLIQKVVQLARESYGHVVVDLEDAEHAEQVRILAASEHIILPMRLDFVSLCRVKKCLEHLTAAHIPREKISLVANRAGQAKELPLPAAAEVLGMPIDYRIADDPGLVNASFNVGTPLIISAPQSSVAVSILQIAAALLGEPHGCSVAERKWWQALSETAAACLSKVSSMNRNIHLARAQA